MIPVKIHKEITLNTNKLEAYNFKDLDITENKIEEFLRKNIEIIFEDGETLLIVGQQVSNIEKGRSDLVALDRDGNIVLIEIKRDITDINSRKEPFEFQAIRYAASFAKVKTIQDLINKFYASYISKYKDEYKLEELTETELGIRNVETFLKKNHSCNTFNQKQRIILIASDFDPQTLSAVAWLINNNIDISCFQIKPVKFNNDYFIDLKKILPPTNIEDFYVDIQKKNVSLKNYDSQQKSIEKTYKPRIPQIFKWQLLKKNDILKIKNFENSEAKVIDSETVFYNEKEVSYNSWGKMVTGWSSICIYEWAIKISENKTLEELRMKKYLEFHDNILIPTSDNSQ